MSGWSDEVKARLEAQAEVHAIGSDTQTWAADIRAALAEVERLDKLNKYNVAEGKAEFERLRADVLYEQERNENNVKQYSAEIERLTKEALSSSPPYYERWKEAEAKLAEAHAYHDENLKEWQHKCSELRAEVERLRRAGNRLANAPIVCPEDIESEREEWRAALRGGGE